MALKVGPNEAERHQVLTALRAGKSFDEATAQLRKEVEADWFDRNREHLLDVAKHGEVKPSPVPDLVKPTEPVLEAASTAKPTKK